MPDGFKDFYDWIILLEHTADEERMMEGANTSMDPEKYIADRLEQYQGWYDKKSVAMKSKYLRMKALSVVGGSLVPVLVNVPWDFNVHGVSPVKLVVTVISLGVVISLSLESVFHYREQWKNYRSTEQLLGHEKFYFRTRVGRYHGLSDEDAFRLLVERVEDAVASENAATLNTMTTASEASGSGKPAASKES
jgi:Protein of unknown function (DUF4231)